MFNSSTFSTTHSGLHNARIAIEARINTLYDKRAKSSMGSGTWSRISNDIGDLQDELDVLSQAQCTICRIMVFCD